MQTFTFTLCTILLLTLSCGAAAQPAPGAIHNPEKSPEPTIRSVPLPPMPGEPLHTTYCPMKIGKRPLRDKPLKVNYSRKPGGTTDSLVAEEKRVLIVSTCPDAYAHPAGTNGSYPPPPPPPPPPPRIICSDLFRVIEEMPRFPGCESLPTIAEKKECAREKMFEFIYENLNYPEAARESGIEGLVVIQFVVEKDGSVTDAKAVRDIGGGCGEEALRVIKLMNQPGLRWTPGKQVGRPVRVLFNIPVKFTLADSIQARPSPPVEEACYAKEKPNTEEPEPENEIGQAVSGISPPPPPCGGMYPPMPPPEEEIFKIVEEMPRFPGCEELPTIAEKKQCSGRKLLEFLYQNITYPALARENCVEGTVVVQFVVEKDGSISDAKVARDIGAQCGEETVRVINLMNERGLKWIPGRQRGRAVRVQYHIPIKFRIDCPDTPPAPATAGQKENKEQAEEALHPSEATPSGTPLTFEPEGFRLFPNPAAEWLNMRFYPRPGRVSLSIVNTSGQVLWQKEYEHTGGVLEERVGLTRWPPGPYFLRVEQQNEMKTHPFVRQR